MRSAPQRAQKGLLLFGDAEGFAGLLDGLIVGEIVQSVIRGLKQCYGLVRKEDAAFYENNPLFLLPQRRRVR